jgi:hypothetical protein
MIPIDLSILFEIQNKLHSITFIYVFIKNQDIKDMKVN